MPVRRRNFLKKLGEAAGASIFLPGLNLSQAADIHDFLLNTHHNSLEEAARDEDFWFQIQCAYTESPELINLNNGGVSPQPLVVQDMQDRYLRFANEAPGYYMWRTMGRVREGVRRQLADLGGCLPEETAIMRNATEALETVINGMDFKEGDEVLTTDQDYPSILNTLEMRSRRDGLIIKKIPIPVACKDMAEITASFEKAMSSQTRLIVLCHIINLTGQILPVREICDMAHKKGIEVVVDGAHSFANLDFKIPDLHCDYFGTSLHKWLSAPFGTGMLYIKQEHIPKIWPMYGYPEGEKDKITKFEHLGTRPFPNELAIGEAIRFHQAIGTQRKLARLQYLKQYWTEKVMDLPRIKFFTALEPHLSCGIANFTITGMDPAKLGNTLTNKYLLYNTVTHHPEIKGVRISPHVYTTLKDLDHLVFAIRELATKSG